MAAIWCLTLLCYLLICVSRIKAEIRCYCNEASCRSSGYMCVSSIERCFSQLAYEDDSSPAAKSIHGCLENLPREERTICEGEGDVFRTRNGPDQQWPVLMCCKADMCNYMDSLDINIYVNTNSNKSSTEEGAGAGSDSGSGSNKKDLNYLEDISQRDLWFKAAVIAVPIAGGFILILLVLLAVRMLRNDSRRHRQLMQIRRHHCGSSGAGISKAQLYVTDHFYPQNHKFVQTQSSSQSSSGLSSSPSPNQIYKDINIKVDYSAEGYDQISDNSSSCPEGSCNSVVVWGKQKQAEHASLV